MVCFDMDEHSAPFDAETRRKLLRLADDLPAIWDALRGRGFRLFDLVVSHVEQMRVRPSDEQPYAHYFREALKERLSFFYALWLPECRGTRQNLAYRSSYLDHLQDKATAGTYAFLGEHARLTRVLLDANDILYSTLKLTDNTRWMGFLDAYQAQKRTEVQALEEHIRALSASPRKPTPIRIARLLEDVLGPLGFEAMLLDTKTVRLVFRRILDQSVALHCEYVDHQGMTAGRSWNLVFVFQSPDRPLWERMKYRTLPLALSIESFIPGGEFYSRHMGEWDSIVLGGLVNSQLLGLLAERWELQTGGNSMC